MLSTKSLCASRAPTLLRLCILSTILEAYTLMRRVVMQALTLLSFAYTKQLKPSPNA